MAKFSKIHYQAVARILIDARELERRGTEPDLLEWIGYSLANLFENDNERFDREHFLAVVRGERGVNSRPPRQSLLDREAEKWDAPQA